MIAEDGSVAARFTIRRTHRGNLFGLPPTGKIIAVQAVNFYRLSGGPFIEERGQSDLPGCSRKLAQYRHSATQELWLEVRPEGKRNRV